MKKTCTVIFAVLLIATCVSFCSCFSIDGLLPEEAETVNPIDFGEKYVKDDSYYIFYSDNTGIYELHFVKSNGDVVSARVDFVWREASDGAVYLFEVGEYHYIDHTEGLNAGVASQPIYFSEDFLTYVKHDSTGATTYRFIKEGSELDKILNN